MSDCRYCRGLGVRYHRDHKGQKRAKLCPYCRDMKTAHRVATFSLTGKKVFGQDGFTVELEVAPEEEPPEGQ